MPDDHAAMLQKYAATGDAEAFAGIVRDYQRLVFSACLRVLGNAADAEDVSQECFLRLARQARTVNTSLGGWLHLCATTMAIDEQRRTFARRTREQEHNRMNGSTNPDPAWHEMAPHVDRALDELPDELRLVLIEHFLQQRTQAEIAGQLGVSPATVSRRVDSGIEVLRKKLKKAGVVVSAAVLAALLTENAASAAAPAALTAALGKIALAGLEPAHFAAPVASSAASSAIAGGLAAAMKIKIAAIIAAAILAVGGIAAVALRQPEAPAQPQQPPAILAAPEPAPAPTIAIHLVAEPADIRAVEATPLAELRLQEQPLFTDKEIASYDWDTHTIHLLPGVQGSPATKALCTAFVVVVGGRRCYVGCYMSFASSYLAKMPVCVGFPKQSIHINPSPVMSNEATVNDVRNDARLYAGLKALNKLRPDDTAWGEPVNGLQAGLRHESEPQPCPIGEDITFLFKLRNVGNMPVKLRYDYFGPRDHSPTIIAANGQGVPVAQPVARWPSRIVTRVVAPGESFVLSPVRLRMQEAGQRWVEPSRRPFVFTTAPGSHKIRQDYSFIATAPDMWSGDLASGLLSFEVIAAQPGPAKRYELNDLAQPNAAIYSVFNLFTADFTWLGRDLDRGQLDKLLAERGLTGDLGFESTDGGRLVAVRGATAALIDAAEWDAVEKLDLADVLATMAEQGAPAVSLAEFAKPPFDRKPFVAIRTANGQVAIVRAVEFREHSVLVEVRVKPQKDK